MDLMLVVMAVLGVWSVCFVLVVLGVGRSAARDQHVDVGRSKPEFARTRRS